MKVQELSDKEFKIAIIMTFNDPRKVMYEPNENFNKEIEPNKNLESNRVFATGNALAFYLWRHLPKVCTQVRRGESYK
jgi:hypothetical protein